MKFIKLDGRHNLYRRGYRYAFLFTSYGPPNSYEVERYVREAEGHKWCDNTHYGRLPAIGQRINVRRPYYVGFCRESTATYVMLKLAE